MIAIMFELGEALEPLLRQRVELTAGATLFSRNDEVRHLHLVEQGFVHLVRYGEDGSAAVMQRAAAGDVLAESSVFAQRYHCDALVVADAVLRIADMVQVRAAFDRDNRLLQCLARHLGHEVMRTRSRVEILSRKTVQDRLDGWFALNGGALPARGAWRSVAEDIGVSPEAFYRELQRRRRSS
jgi:CRP/FNR family transcriptional regulator, dissimilatory nitrate respiration regulator